MNPPYLFRICSETIEDSAIWHDRLSYIPPNAGGVIIFEGRVRNISHNKPVNYLIYEAYEELAKSEGEKIIEEAKKLNSIETALCLHRTGCLRVGELALWLQVTARHRQAAFSAAEYIIEQLKKRVPIWKNEFYMDKTSDWIQ
jgi:molybdopterin synthase catalytic subunit